MNNPTPDIPGMPCPDCGARIVVSMHELLSGNAIVCKCGLKLRVDEQRSHDTLRDLRELQRRLNECELRK